MSDRFLIELDREGQLQHAIARAIQGLEQPQALMESLGAMLEENINRRFDRKVAPDGTAWLPLADSTLASYERKYKGNIPGSLLERTRRMRDTLSHQAAAASVEVGFSVPYAVYHETGTRRGLPRRQLLTDDPIAGTLGAGDRQDLLDQVESFLGGLLAG